ncbi:MAG: phenylalanine--tRNA ligase subunit beta [Clostridiales bacterium]|jgi:phenylalanyl-tRNA synthetase beta chain|nr:phenylalanine--tRNA ligase subunit beta [Clostridiales bacterium]
MRVPYTWLKDFIHTDLSAQELAELLTRSGIEVEEITSLRPGFTGIIVAEVLSIDKHPEADKLFIVKVYDGSEELTIVAGIDNMQPGDKVPLAVAGASLPGDIVIKKTKLRGVESRGMLCSADELGLDLNPGMDGVLILDKDAQVGVALEDTLVLNDPILILGLTPNRADCLGLLGVAHEVAALTGGDVQLPDISPLSRKAQAPVPRIRIEDSSLCARYSGLVIGDVKIGLSPVWMQARLLQAGIRPISNIVDITNYVMWEWGQPLHAFDYPLLAEHSIVVRPAREGEELVTLDNVKRGLTEEMLVIADAQNPVAVAGVMGGLETEITDNTETVLLESAHFNPVSIRRTGRSLGLYSEAQQRFEKGVDVNGCVQAVRRAAKLIELLGAGRSEGDVVDEYVAPLYPQQIRLRPDRARKLIGLEISQQEMAAIFQRQGFSVEEGTHLHVKVPTSRPDLESEVDLIEEVARINGYDKIATTLPSGVITQGRRTERQQAVKKVRETMLACGLTEVINYTFVSPNQLKKLHLEQQNMETVVVANPLSEEQSVMRTELLGGLLSTIAYNGNRNVHDVQIFEMGAVYKPYELPLTRLPEEKTKLGLALTGALSAEHWRQKPQTADFFSLKGIIEALLTRLNINQAIFRETEEPFCQPGQAAAICLGDERIGWLGRIHPEVLDAYGLEQPVYAAEIDMESLLGLVRLVPEYTMLPRYPALLRDLAVVVPDEVSAIEVTAVIYQTGGALVSDVSLFDLYRGPQIPAGSRSLAFAISYRDPSRTLSDEDVTQLHQEIEQTLQESLGTRLRG